jgi:hypothetical protein
MKAGISFGVHVRIIETDETGQGGWARLIGYCTGFTTPSITGVEVIGGPADQAFHVQFDGDSIPDAWFHPGLVEYVDQAPGTEITIGVARFVREPTGEWRRMEAGLSPAPRRRWWKQGTRFWSQH